MLGRQFLKATVAGWAVGVLLTVALAVAAEGIGVGGSQSPVGLGMGMGVGFIQSRVLRRVDMNSRAWFLSSSVGLTAPFAIIDLARLPFSLPVCVAAGGLIVGVWQAALLRSRSAAWIAACVVGWSLAGGAAALGNYLPRAFAIRGLPGAALFLLATFAGGWILGAVTCTQLPRWPDPQTGSSQSE